MTKQLRLWRISCSHVGTDLKFGHERLADAIRQSEEDGDDGGPTLEWDIAVHLGDHLGGQTTPTDDEGREIVRQFGVSTRHRREDFYTIAGNRAVERAMAKDVSRRFQTSLEVITAVLM